MSRKMFATYSNPLFLATGEYIHPVGDCVPAVALGVNEALPLQQMSELNAVQKFLKVLVLRIAAPQHFGLGVRIYHLVPERAEGHVGSLRYVKQFPARWLRHYSTPDRPELRER